MFARQHNGPEDATTIANWWSLVARLTRDNRRHTLVTARDRHSEESIRCVRWLLVGKGTYGTTVSVLRFSDRTIEVPTTFDVEQNGA